MYHPKEANFESGSNRGEYPCCGQSALRFDTIMRKSGCCAKNHTPEHVVDFSNMEKSEKGEVRDSASKSDAHNSNTTDGINTTDNSIVTPSVVNTLIRNLDLVTIPVSSNAASGGYEEDRIAGLVNGDKSIGGMETKQKSRNNEADDDSATISKKSKDHPRRPSNNNNSNSRSSRPSTANSSGRRRSIVSSSSNDRPSTAGRYSNTRGTDNTILNDIPVQPHNDTYRGGIVSYSSTSRRGSNAIAGQTVGTPDAFKANPQRRRMWKLDLQREEDVVRMNALVNKLETLRRDDNDNINDGDTNKFFYGGFQLQSFKHRTNK